MVLALRLIAVTGWLLSMLCVLAPSAQAGEGGVVKPLPPPAVATAPPSPPPQPMTVVRMRGKDRCGSRCPEWIMAEGIITPGTPQRFRQQLAAMGQAKLPVVIDSEGGDLDAALAIGRMIRAQGLTTVIGRAQARGCAPRDASCAAGRPKGLAYDGFVMPQGACSGTCLFVLAGGVERAGYWISAARLPAPGRLKTQKSGGDAEARIAAYLAEMGISPGLVPRIRRSSLPLDRADMLHFGLATSKARVEDFTGSSLCAGYSPAPNCLRPAVESASGDDAARVPAKRRAAPPPGRIIIWGGIENM